MPNPLNARIGRTRPSPAFLCPVEAQIEASRTEGERITLRRRSADRGSLDAVKAFCSAVFRIGARRIDRLDGTSAIGR